MSLLPRRCARIPRGSRSMFTLLAFLLTLSQHLAEGESAGPAGRTAPDTPQRATAVTRSQGLGKGSASTLL